jgi:pimeloyl-ACP methyl ester carboxylesterase
MQPFRDRMPADQATYALGVDQLFGTLISPAWRARLLANDLEALRALTQDRESIADVLPSITVPCMLFVGELDPRLAQVRQCVSQLPNATFFSLPGCDHISTGARADLIIPKVKAFLHQVARD